MDGPLIRRHISGIEECVYRGTYFFPPSLRTTISEMLNAIKNEVVGSANGTDLAPFYKALADMEASVATAGRQIQTGGNSGFHLDFQNFLREIFRLIHTSAGNVVDQTDWFKPLPAVAKPGNGGRIAGPAGSSTAIPDDLVGTTGEIPEQDIEYD